jgi:hypothetical protein
MRSSALPFKHELLLSAVPNKIWGSGSSPSMWSEDRRSSRRWRRSSSSGGAGRVGADWAARPRGREWGLGLRDGSRSVAQGSTGSPLTLGFGRFGYAPRLNVSMTRQQKKNHSFGPPKELY